MPKLKKNLTWILLISLSLSLISSDIGWKFSNRENLAIATEEKKPWNYNLPGFPEDEGRTFDWSEINWDRETTLYQDAVEFREKVLKLENQGKMKEISSLKNPKIKMSDEKVLAYYNVPEEVRNLVRMYVSGKINKEQLKNEIQRINKPNSVQTNNQKVEDLSKIININTAPKLKVNKVNFIKNPINSGKILLPIEKTQKSQNDKYNYSLLNDEVLRENVRKMMENRKTSYLDKIKNFFIPRAKAADSIPFIDYYDDIGENPLDNALYYLSLSQNSDGSFGVDNSYEKTYKIVYALSQFGKTNNDQFNNAINYLANATPLNIREKTFKIRILNLIGWDYQSLLADVLVAQKSSYAYGFEKEYESDMLTTIEVMETLGIINNNNYIYALTYLLNKISDNGRIYYEDGQTPSYHLTNELIRALKPVDGLILDINGNQVKIHDKIMAMINFLSSNYNTEIEELAGTKNLIDYAFTARSFKMYSVEQEKLDLILAKLGRDQYPDGSFASDITTTSVAMSALAKPNLIIKDIVNDGSLTNRQSAKFKITVKNQGYAPTSKIDLFIFIDNYKFSENFNIDQQGILLNPGDEVVIPYQFPNTESFKGDTNIKFYFEDANDFNYDDNWKTKTFNFSSAVGNPPAMEVYYIAHKYSSNNQPLISVRWPQKVDPDRYSYVAGFREKGTSVWKYWGIEGYNGNYWGPFKDNTVYEVTAGVLAKDQATIYMYSNITEVKTSGVNTQNLGTVSGYVTDNNERLSKADLWGYYSDESGNFSQEIENGTHIVYVSEKPYEQIDNKYAISVGQVTSNVRVFTRLKEDSTPPVVTKVNIADASNYKVKNQTTVKLIAGGTDDVSIKDGDFYIWNIESSTWEYLGTYQVPQDFSNEIMAEWYVPANYLGTNYKIKAVLRDFRGNQSTPMEGGSFEIYDGTLPTGTVQVNGLTNNEWSLGEEKEVAWTVNSISQLKEIYAVTLHFGSKAIDMTEHHLNKDTRSINYKMPSNYSFTTDSAYISVTAIDVNNNEGTFDSTAFKIVDKNPAPQAPWSEQLVVDLLLSGSGIAREIMKVIDNNDGSKEFIYQESDGFCDQPNGYHQRLIYRKFVNGVWENPVVIKDNLFKVCEPLHYFGSLQAQKDDFGKIYIAYGDYLYGYLSYWDQNEVYYAEVKNNQLLGVQQLSNDNTDSGGIKMTLSNNRVYIVWAEGHSWTTDSGEPKVKYIEGTELNNFTAPQIITPTQVYMGIYNLVVDNEDPMLVYRFYCQFFTIKRVNNVWGNPLVIHRPDIKKTYLDNFTEDKDKFSSIVVNDTNNSENYLWLNSVNTGMKLESVLRSNNFVHKQDIINAFCNNEYGSNSYYVNLFALENSYYDLFYSHGTTETSYNNSVYGINFVNDVSKSDITPVKVINFARVAGNDNVKNEYKILRRADSSYHILFDKQWQESNISYSSVYHIIADYDYVYYLARVSNPTLYVLNYITNVSATDNYLFVYYPGSFNSEYKTLYNYANMSALPIAKGGNDQTIIAGTEINLDGSLSFDNWGKPITAYKWLVDSSPEGSNPIFSDPNISKPTFTPDKIGKFVLKLVVNNGNYDSLPDFVVIEGLNRKPIANAEIDQTVPLNQKVVLDGSKSSDPDSDPITFKWTLVSKPSGSNSLLTDASTSNPTFTPDKSGDYLAELIVNDSKENSLPDQVLITAVNQKPIALAGPDQNIDIGQKVNLDGGLSYDIDNDPLKFKWTLLGKPEGSISSLSSTDKVITDFIPDKKGQYIVELIANDGLVDSAPDQVIVTALNQAPIANAGPDQKTKVGLTVTLSGDLSTDPDDDQITSYFWSFKEKPAGSTASLNSPNNITSTFISDKKGSYVIQLIVNDNEATSLPDEVTIITENSQPVANAGSDQKTKVGLKVTLNGNLSSDPDGDQIKSYNWTFKQKPADSVVSFNNPNNVTTTFIPDKKGSYIVQLIVNDDETASLPDEITIITENSPPIANAGTNQVVKNGSKVTLNGTASSDPDNDKLQYKWRIISKPLLSKAVLISTSVSNPTFTVDKIGIYKFGLQVYDGKLWSPEDTVIITTKIR